MAIIDHLSQDHRAGPVSVGSARSERVGAPVVVWIYLTALFIPMAFSLGPLAMNPLRLLLLIITPILGARLLMGHYGRIILTDWLFLIYMIWSAVALSVNNPEMAVSNSGVTAMECLGGYLVGRAAIRDRETFVAFIRVLGLFILLSLIPAIYEVATGDAILMKIVDAIPGVKSLGDGAYQRLGIPRVQVAFQHPILYGLICSTAISLTWVGRAGEMSTARRAIQTALICLATFLSLSSGAILAIVLHLGLIGWAWIFSSIKKRWLLLLILIVIGYVTIDLLSSRTPMRVFMTYATFSAQTAYHRSYIFQWGMVNVWDNPIFGLGFNDWVRPSHIGASVDNFWLLTAMRYGIPAFLALAGGVLYLILRVGARDFTGDARMMRYRKAWMFTMIAVCFTLATVHVWSGPYSFVFCLFGSGAWFLAASVNRDGEEAVAEMANAKPSRAPQQPNTAGRAAAVRYTRFDGPSETPRAAKRGADGESRRVQDTAKPRQSASYRRPPPKTSR